MVGWISESRFPLQWQIRNTTKERANVTVFGEDEIPKGVEIFFFQHTYAYFKKLSEHTPFYADFMRLQSSNFRNWEHTIIQTKKLGNDAYSVFEVSPAAGLSQDQVVAGIIDLMRDRIGVCLDGSESLNFIVEPESEITVTLFIDNYEKEIPDYSGASNLHLPFKLTNPTDEKIKASLFKPKQGEKIERELYRDKLLADVGILDIENHDISNVSVFSLNPKQVLRNLTNSSGKVIARFSDVERNHDFHELKTDMYIGNHQVSMEKDCLVTIEPNTTAVYILEILQN